MLVILISGCAGSGKTYLGKKIVEFMKEKKFRALQTEYSKYIKMYAKEILNYDGDRETKPRKFLQDTGSFIREDLKDSYFFTRRMLEDFRIYENYFDVVVISDVRLLQEIEEIIDSKYDVLTIMVRNELAQKGLTIEEKNHITENEFRKYIDYDYVIKNEVDVYLDNIALKIVEDIVSKKGSV